MEEHPVLSVRGGDIHYVGNIRAMFIIKARSGHSILYTSYTCKKSLLPNDRNHDHSDPTINEECDPFARWYAYLACAAFVLPHAGC